MYFKSNNHYPLASQTNPPMNRKDHIGLLFYLEKNIIKQLSYLKQIVKMLMVIPYVYLGLTMEPK